MTDGKHTRIWSYTYNAYGQVLSAIDPDNHVTTTTYDSTGDVATIKNALNQVWSFTSYDADGKLLSVTDPNGLVSAFRSTAGANLSSPPPKMRLKKRSCLSNSSWSTKTPRRSSRSS